MSHSSSRSDFAESDRLVERFGREDWSVLQHAWSQRPVHLPAGARRFDQLFSWKDLQKLVDARRHIGQAPDLRRVRREPSRFARAAICEVTRNGEPANPSNWSMPDPDPRIDPVKLNHALRGGSSLVLRRLDDFSPGIRQLCNALEVEWCAPTNAVAVASWNDTPGLGLHLDAEEVLVLQISGHKRWKVWEPTRRFPFGRMNDDIAVEPEGLPCMDVVLGPGDVIHLPCGWWHFVEPLGEPSLHLTFNVFRSTPLDIFDSLLDEISGDAMLGTAIARDPQTIREQVDALRGVVLDADPTTRAASRANQIAARHDLPIFPRLANK